MCVESGVAVNTHQIIIIIMNVYTFVFRAERLV